MLIVGFLDKLTGKKEELEKKKKEEEAQPEGKYKEACALCGSPGTEKKWMGQYWHKRCSRIAKKGARKMI